MPRDHHFRACTRDASFLLGCAKIAGVTGQLSIRYDPLPRLWSVWIGLHWLGEGDGPNEAMEQARDHFETNFLTRNTGR